MKEIYLAGGCFWGVEHYLSVLPGVKATRVGYANGNTTSPTYEDVCRRDSGHAETVHVEYNPFAISLTFLLERFFEIIDPTSINRQGNDEGTQYRTGVYYTDDSDQPIIAGAIALLQEGCDSPVTIEVCRLENFYTAEEYHQDYLHKNPEGYCHIDLAAFERARSAFDCETLRRPDLSDELRSRLTDLQFEVTQNGATEPPFDNEFHDHREPGIYVDVVSGEALFVSGDKFDSGCGWPSFSRPIDRCIVSELEDLSHGRRRTEVRGSTSGAHLGHVFDDGPTALGGLRYCINSAALRFVHADNMAREGYGHLLPLVERP